MTELLIYSGHLCYESTLFFINNTCIGAVSGNDGEWRHEWFNPIFKKINISITPLKDLNPE